MITPHDHTTSSIFNTDSGELHSQIAVKIQIYLTKISGRTAAIIDWEWIQGSRPGFGTGIELISRMLARAP